MVVSRGNAWERRSHCQKSAGTLRNGVPIVERTQGNGAVDGQLTFSVSSCSLQTMSESGLYTDIVYSVILFQ